MIVSQNETTVTMAMPIEPRYFGMFTDEGNYAIAFIVDYHIAHKNDWPTVYQTLRYLARHHPTKFGEATDTVVREMVYDACSFTSDFYV